MLLIFVSYQFINIHNQAFVLYRCKIKEYFCNESLDKI